MARYILCADCNKKMEGLADRFDELYESVEGESKGEYLCDLCGFPNPIHKGDKCFAAVALNNRSHFNYEFQIPEVWMDDFIIPISKSKTTEIL